MPPKKSSTGSSTQPRKFAEKIDYLSKCNEADQKAFEEAIAGIKLLTHPDDRPTQPQAISLPNVAQIVGEGCLVVFIKINTFFKHNQQAFWSIRELATPVNQRIM